MKGHYTQTDLKELGWTEAMIKSLLPEPELKPNPMYRKAAPMKTWSISVVETAMQTQEYTDALCKAQRRKFAAQKAVETKVSNLKNEIADVVSHISFKPLSEDELRHKVLCEREQYYRRRAEYNYCSDYYFETPDAQTLERWTVNYIRHHLCIYDDVLRGMRGKVGSLETYPEFKDAILDKIAEAYPAHAEECTRQKYIWT